MRYAAIWSQPPRRSAPRARFWKAAVAFTSCLSAATLPSCTIRVSTALSMQMPLDRLRRARGKLSRDVEIIRRRARFPVFRKLRPRLGPLLRHLAPWFHRRRRARRAEGVASTLLAKVHLHADTQPPRHPPLRRMLRLLHLVAEAADVRTEATPFLQFLK